MDTQKIPAQTAIYRALEIACANPIYGGRYSDTQLLRKNVEETLRFYIEFGRGWAISCNLSVHINCAHKDERSKGEVNITWPSSAYTVASAQATIALHQEVTNLAALLQSALDEMNILSIKDSVIQ